MVLIRVTHFLFLGLLSLLADHISCQLSPFSLCWDLLNSRLCQSAPNSELPIPHNTVGGGNHLLHHLAREELSWKIFISCFLGGSYSEAVNERITGLDEESPINKSAAGTNDKTGNISTKKTRPNSWAKQVREIERGHWILDFMIYEMKNGEGKV